MTSLTGSTATLRRRLLGVLAATGLAGGTAVVLLSAPSAVGASDPCAASEMARAIGNVARSMSHAGPMTSVEEVINANVIDSNDPVVSPAATDADDTRGGA